MVFIRRMRCTLRAVLGILFLSFATASSGAAPSLEEFGALPAVQMVSISPNGQTIAFRRYSPTQDLVVAYSLTENKIVQAVDVTSIKPQQLRFLDDSRVVMIASDANRKLLGYKGVYEISTGFVWNWESGAVTQLLTPGDNILTGQLGLGDIAGISPDGKKLYMPALVASDARLKQSARSASLAQQNPNKSLMEVDIENPRKPNVYAKGSRDTINYFIGTNGQVLAEEIFNDMANYHQVIAYHDGQPVEIYREDTEERYISLWAVTQDQKSLIITSRPEANGYRTFHSMSLADGSLSEPLFERKDSDVDVVITDANYVAHGIRYAGLRPSYQFFDDKMTKRMGHIQAQFPDHSIWLRDWSPDWKHLVIQVEGTTSAGDYYLFSEDGNARFLAAARPGIEAQHINPIVAYEYKSRDGVAIPTLLTVPLAHIANPQNMPAVILPHGGPESHDWLGFDWLAQALASRGYLVVQPQFRGSSGFGTAHRTAGQGEWGRRSQDDITDSVKQLTAEKLLDPNRVCIMGGSYGGFAALAGGAFTPELYKCVVSINGVADVRQMLKEEQADHGRYSSVLAYWKRVIALGDTSKSNLDAMSPANAAANFAAPVLLLHGDKDTTVRFDQSKTMHRQLKRAKKDVQLVKLKGEDHYLSEPATRLQALTESVKFIDAHIGKKAH